MKAFSKLGLLLAAALLATTAVAASAQAVVITPDNTAVSGVATLPTLTYEGTDVVCDTGTAAGTTGTNSASITTLSVTFQGNCNVAGLAATVACSGTVTLTALTAADPTTPEAGDGTGTIDLNSGFNCQITVPFTCTVDVDGPQDTGSTTEFDASTDTLTAAVPVLATRTGSSLCGPASGTASFVADYVITPTNLTIDP